MECVSARAAEVSDVVIIQIGFAAIAVIVVLAVVVAFYSDGED